MEYYSAMKKNKELINTPTWMDAQQYNPKWKKPDTKYYILYDSIFEKFLEEAKLERLNTDQQLPKLGGSGDRL